MEDAAAAIRMLLAQWRIEVSWWRGGLPTPTPRDPGLSGGVCGSTVPFMSLSIRQSVTEKREREM